MFALEPKIDENTRLEFVDIPLPEEVTEKRKTG